MSHSGRMLDNTLESYPRDDLFQIDTTLLASFAEQINDLADRPRVRVLPRIDHFDRFVSVIVYRAARGIRFRSCARRSAPI